MDNQQLSEGVYEPKTFEFPEYESIYFEDEDVINASCTTYVCGGEANSGTP